MTSLQESLLINAVIDAALLVIGFAAPLAWLAFFAVCVLQCLIGFFLLIGEKSRPYGQGMLIVGALGLLVGFSVCSGMSSW